MSLRRLVVLVLVLLAAAVPAAVLRVLCVGNACDRASIEATVPFCSLPADLRDRIANGFYEGRSPDVLAVARDAPVFSEAEGLRIPWPRVGGSAELRVPLAIAGPGVVAGAALPSGVTLDRVAPTVAELVGFDRPFPEVRSGTAVDGVAGPPGGERPRLLVLVAWKGVGSAELDAAPDAWPFLASVMDEGVGTLDAETGSLPADPTAVLTTIGTGGLPSQHGITGSLVRNDAGKIVPSFGPGAPVQVIATLADDLEEADRRTLVGLVGGSEADRGLVGGGWYPDQDPVDVVLGDGGAAEPAVQMHLATGYGSDGVPDVLGVALDGDLERLDRWTRMIVRSAREATDGRVVVVVAGTGSSEPDRTAVPSTDIIERIEGRIPGGHPLVAAEVAGGLFLDQRVLTEQEITGQTVVDILLSTQTPEGETMFADAFQGFAVSFARYC